MEGRPTKGGSKILKPSYRGLLKIYRKFARQALLLETGAVIRILRFIRTGAVIKVGAVIRYMRVMHLKNDRRNPQRRSKNI